MKSTITLGIALAIGTLGMGTAAHADILAGGPIFGNGQTDAACRLFNAGTSPVTVTSNQIIRETGGIGILEPISFDNCGALAAGSACVIVANFPGVVAAHACKMVVSPSGANVRGALEIREGGLNGLNTVELR